MPWIHFKDQKFRSFEVPVGSNLMKSLQESGVPVASSCGGEGVCAKCRLSVESGSEIDLPNETEQFLMQKFKFDSSMRISCQLKVTADLTLSASYW